MNKIKTIVAVGMVCVGVMAHADTKTTYRDAQGRIQGTVDHGQVRKDHLP